MFKSMFVNLVAMGFLLLLVDGCVYRDPHVKLAGGYAISSISHRSPCGLHHEGNSNAVWSAMPSNGDDEIVLLNMNDGSSTTVKSLAEIMTRFAAGTVDLSQVAPRIDDVTGYAFNEQFIAGQCSDSYFVLAVDTHSNESWQARDDWARSVAGTGLSANRLSDPKAWLRQWRHPATYLVYFRC